MNKITFISPGVRYLTRSYSQPLGVLYLVSYVRKKFPEKFKFDLIDQAIADLTSEQVLEEVKKINPDIVGFSCLSLDADQMQEIAGLIKKALPDCLIFLGGPYASVFYDQALERTNIDIVIIGEGEKTFAELIQRFLDKQPLDNVKGTAYKKDGKIILAPPRELVDNLDSLPFPAWDLIDFKKYSKLPSMNLYSAAKPWSIIFTSRGCPYHCLYCHNIFGKKARFRSAENVIEEIEILTKKYGVKEIQIVDDVFNLDLNRAKKICDLIVDRGIKIKICFPNGVRADRMDRELIKKLKNAGCYSVTCAIETASLRLQKEINKNLDLDRVKQVIAWLDEEGIITHGFCMLGFPGETEEEMEMTIKYATNSRLMVAIFFTVVVYPKTKIFEYARKVYTDFNFNQQDYSHFFIGPENHFIRG
ncbi:MAG: radical SAM protein [bacterium]